MHPDFNAAKDYALSQLTILLPPDLAYHGLHHTRDQVLPAVELFCREMDISARQQLVIATAALFHDLGFIKKYTDNERIGAETAASVLPGFGYQEADIAEIKKLILATRMPQKPQTLAEQILCDADLVSLGRDIFFETSMMLRRETESYLHPVSLQQWWQQQYSFLGKHHYFTAVARTLLDTQKEANRTALRPLLSARTEQDQVHEYDISKNDAEFLRVRTHLQEAAAWSLKHIRLFFTERNTRLWDHYPELYLLTGKAILKHGEPLLAYDIFSTGLQGLNDTVSSESTADRLDPIAVQLIRHQAISLARSGAPSSAELLLNQLISNKINDSETMGLLGRVYKDMASLKPDQKAYYLHQAHAVYFRAYRQAVREHNYEGAYYNGINAATLAFLQGYQAHAGKVSKEVEQLCLSLEKQGEESSLWLDATLGEAALLQGDLNRAEKYYEKACCKADSDVSALTSIIKQARLIIAHSDIDTTIKRTPSCTLPAVIVFSGHMIDTLSRKGERFPTCRQEEIQAKIRLEIARLGGGIGYAAAAAGSDILFLEAMLEAGGKIHIILPVDIENFKEQSVLPCGHNWEERFDAVTEQAESLTILDTFNPRNFENSLEFTNMYLFGIARIRAEQMETFLRPLAVLQVNDAGARGGTASMVRLWQRQQVEYSLISLQGSCTSTAPKAVSLAPVPSPACSCSEKAQHHTSLPMLFADVRGYSQLSEDEAVCFSGSFLARVAKILKEFSTSILSKRTAGDGLFLVFHDLESATQVARSLQNMINSHDWQLDNLPKNLQMRISLDAGPCYSYIDPVMNKLEFCGNYVVRAARLEPITPPGHIYASDTFVALCRSAGMGRGAFSYAGQVTLPKGYGTMAAYHVTL